VGNGFKREWPGLMVGSRGDLSPAIRSAPLSPWKSWPSTVTSGAPM